MTVSVLLVLVGIDGRAARAFLPLSSAPRSAREAIAWMCTQGLQHNSMTSDSDDDRTPVDRAARTRSLAVVRLDSGCTERATCRSVHEHEAIGGGG